MMGRLVLDRITKTYRNGAVALRDVSLELSDGIFALLGPNGAGKSTLMHVVAGLLRPTSGNVSIDGLTPQADLEAYRVSVGYLPQAFGFPPGATVKSVLEQLGRLRGLTDRSERADRIEWALSRVNLLARANSRVSTLSGGMKQRLGIAQALLHEPPVLVLDEPTVGLDPEERNNLLLLLSEYGSTHTVLLSTHLIDDVDAVCQRMAFISNGSLLSIGSREDILAPLEGNVYSLQSDPLEVGRKLYDAVEQGRRVSRYLIDHGAPADAHPEVPTVRDAYALAIPRAS